MDEPILPGLRCLITQRPLKSADRRLCDDLNRAIAQGHVYNRLGRQVTQPVEAGLTDEYKTVLYPIRQGIPQLLADQLIPLDCLRTPDPQETSAHEREDDL